MPRSTVQRAAQVQSVQCPLTPYRSIQRETLRFQRIGASTLRVDLHSGYGGGTVPQAQALNSAVNLLRLGSSP